VPAGADVLALPGERAEFQSRDAAVQLSLWGNLPELYDFPVLETAAVFHENADASFALTLQRGRIILTQLRSKRTAQVAVAFEKDTYEFILSEPGTQVAIETFGRWPVGIPFVRNPRPDRNDDVPTQVFLAYVLKGTASLKIGSEQFLMPASSSFRWDNVVGRDRLPKRNMAPPAWADGSAGKADTRALQAATEKMAQLVARSGPEKAIQEALNGNDFELHRIAVYSLGAMDDLPGLVDALSNPRQADVRSAAITALQHWIGKGPAQDAKLYNLFIKERMYTPNQAEIVLTLLHGFRENDRNRATTYETLIEYLRHSKIAIRELASSYLNRWVPEGRTKILFDAGGSESQLRQGYDEWKKLVPNGKVPSSAPAR
jgi:hypothetical protein